MMQNKGEMKGYDMNVFMSTKVRIDDAIGVFESDSRGQPLRVKKSGNGAVIPFLKRFEGKKAIVFIVND